MMMDYYDKYLMITDKYKLSVLDKEIIKWQLNIDINFQDIFKNLKDKAGFTIQNYIDNFIYTQIKDIYKSNYFFQYSIYLLSKYKFDDKADFIDSLEKIYKALKELDINKLDKITCELTNKTIKFISDQEKIEQEKLANKINNFFKNPKVLNFITNKFNDKNITRQLFNDNYFNGQSYESRFLKALILLQGDIDIDELLNSINNSDDIINYVLSKLKIKLCIENDTETEKIKLLDYIYNTYIKEGYFFHGTTSKEIEKIKKYGLTPQNFYFDNKLIQETNDIFEKHRLYKAFEGKSGEMKTFNFYVTDSTDCGIYYANQSPEYLSRFCANGHHMQDLYVYDREAFFRRDFASCYSNVSKFINENNFTDNEKNTVLTNFQKLWNQAVVDNMNPVIFIGKRKIIGRDDTIKYNIVKQNINNYSLEQILKFMLKPDNIHDKRFSPVDSDYLSIIKLPNLYKFYKIKSEDKTKEKRYILCDNKKIYPDLIINAIFGKQIAFKISDDKTMHKKGSVIFIPNDVNKLKIKINDNFYIQNIDMLIAESATGITEEGKQLIKQLRNIYPVNEITGSYYKEFCKLYNEYDHSIEQLFCMIDNYYIKYKTMSLYHDYYVNIASDKINIEHYKIDEINYLRKYKQTELLTEEGISRMLELLVQEVN